MEIIRKSEAWDAVVVGSGANGGAAARALTRSGLRVLVLEAGEPVRCRSDHGSFLPNATRALYRHLVSRRQEVQKCHPTYWSTNPDFFVDDRDNPYTTPEGKPFRWIRVRRVGGRTLTWDAVTPRFSDVEFDTGTNGHGVDWPIRHAELAPYYADLERFLGVHGSREGLEQLPDGDFLAARPMTPAEGVFKARLEAKYRDRRVIISRGIRAGRVPDHGQEHSRISSTATTIAAAQRTGRMKLRTGAVVSRVVVDMDGSRATGVEFTDAKTGVTEEVRARVVFLCASTIETLRILMNSRSRAHPGGIGASSGVLGHYLMDHSAGNVYFSMPDVASDGTDYGFSGCDSILIPRYRNLGERARDTAGLGFGVWGGVQRLPVPSFLRKSRSVVFGFLCARSETVPHFQNRVELHPTLRDAWGVPAAHIVCEWQPEDLAIAELARRETHEMVEAVGGRIGTVTDLFHTPFVTGFIRHMQKEWTLSTPGMFVHEVGGARMGTDPKSSVVDPFCRAWDVKNVFVTDGACWPTSGWQNPTLTEMAITARACARAAADLVNGRPIA